MTILWLIPAVVAVGVLALPAQRPDLAKWAGLLGTVAALVVSVGLAIGFDPDGPRYQFVTNVRWIPSFGARYELGLDGIGLVLILLTTVLMPILVLAAGATPIMQAPWTIRAVAGRRAHTPTSR